MSSCTAFTWNNKLVSNVVDKSSNYYEYILNLKSTHVLFVLSNALLCDLLKMRVFR